MNAHIRPIIRIKLGNMHSLVQMSNIFAYLDILKYHNVSQMCDYDRDVLNAKKWLIFECIINSWNACKFRLQHRRSKRNDTFSEFWPKITKMEKKFKKFKTSCLRGTSIGHGSSQKYPNFSIKIRKFRPETSLFVTNRHVLIIIRSTWTKLMQY